MSAATLLAELKKQGIGLTLNGGKLKLSANAEPPSKLIERVQKHKAELIDELKTQRLKAALVYLESGETPAIRLQVSDAEQVLILKDDTVPESITVDCPTFTLDELKKLIGARPWQIARIYDLKADFGDYRMRVTDIEAVKP